MTDAMPGVAFVPVHRAAILVDLGRAREAMPIVVAALTRAGSGELPPGVRGCRAQRRLSRSLCNIVDFTVFDR